MHAAFTLIELRALFYGDIYATCLTRHFNVDIKYTEDSLLPRGHLDYESMKEHNFVNRVEPHYQ